MIKKSKIIAVAVTVSFLIGSNDVSAQSQKELFGSKVKDVVETAVGSGAATPEKIKG